MEKDTDRKKATFEARLPDPESMPPSDLAIDPEKVWFETVYQGDNMPQFTLRATVMGAFLGGFMSLSNLYVGLKTGWSLGVAITACILSYAVYKTLMAVMPKLFPTEMSILENNCMQSTASSAGYSTGGTLMSAITAYLLITGHHLPMPILMIWTICLACLGVFMAIPMKRQMINVDQLKFPSGIAAAETLRSLHQKGTEATQKARALGISGLLGAAIAWFRDAGLPFAIPGMFNFPGAIRGFALAKLTISLEMSSIMVAAGAIMGWRIAWSMLLGAIINFAWLAPWMAEIGAIDASKIGYRAIVSWSTWTGSGMLVTSALLQFAFNWRSILRAFAGLSTLFSGAKTEDTPASRIEVPTSWFLTGTTLAGLGCIAVLYFAFNTALWMGFVAVILSFFLAIVACRTTGESDITPMSAMGKITQLAFGALAPSNITTNLMTAGVTAGAAASSADLLTDLKSGYLLGANPRKQFLAQLIGVFAGTVVVVPAFYLLIPSPAALGTSQWPAPTAQVWAAVARLLANGFHTLHPTALIGLLIGSGVGLVLPILERLFPKQAKYIPSATGLGLAFVIPFFNSLSMFIGAAIAEIMERKWPKTAEKYVIPVASGFIAGESLMGIIVALLIATKVISGT